MSIAPSKSPVDPRTPSARPRQGQPAAAAQATGPAIRGTGLASRWMASTTTTTPAEKINSPLISDTIWVLRP